MERRDVLKAMGATAAGFVAGNAPTAEAADPTAQKNPYGGKPGGGISLPQWPKDFTIDLGKLLGQPPKPEDK
jgi:hypothetical protein